MTGILPEPHAGGLEIRDPMTGSPLNPEGVQNAYVPAPGYVSTCPLTALPSDCTARIEAKQINAIVSELISFAECLDPDGPWDCASLKNLCAAFTQYVKTNAAIVVGDAPPPDPVINPFWWDSENGILYVYYEDDFTKQWVQANGTVVDQVTIIGTGIMGRPLSVGAVDCGSY